MIKVKILVLGGDSKIVDVPEGSNVAAALAHANISASGMTCAINGENASLNDLLRDRAVITVSNKVAGGR